MRLPLASLFRSLAALLLAACATNTVAATHGGIVALVPSFADDCYAVGAGAQLVAVSAYTDDPRAARLPRVADATSVDVEQIVALAPRVVVGIPSQSRLVEPLRRAHLRVVLLADDGYAQIFTNLRAIGALSGRSRQAAATIGRLARETAALQRRTLRYRRHPRVFIVLASAPIWTAGPSSYISTLLELAGGRNAAAGMRLPYAQYSAEALVESQPDVIVADRSVHLAAQLSLEPWRSLRAVRAGRVYTIDSDLLERPGPQYNAAIAWLIDRLSPIARQS